VSVVPFAGFLILFSQGFEFLFQTIVTFVLLDHVESEFLDFGEELGLHVADAETFLCDLGRGGNVRESAPVELTMISLAPMVPAT
jgi:hypothetical protein